MPRFLSSILILGLFSLPAPAGSQPSAPERVRESESGTEFPVILTPPGTTTTWTRSHAAPRSSSRAIREAA